MESDGEKMEGERVSFKRSGALSFLSTNTKGAYNLKEV